MNLSECRTGRSNGSTALKQAKSSAIRLVIINRFEPPFTISITVSISIIISSSANRIRSVQFMDWRNRKHEEKQKGHGEGNWIGPDRTDQCYSYFSSLLSSFAFYFLYSLI